MDLETFLYLGAKVNRAGKDDIHLLRLNIAQEEDCEARQNLLKALDQRHAGPYRYYTQEEKEGLLQCARKWSSLKKEQQDKVMDVLGQKSPVEDLGAGRSSALQFYDLLRQFLQTDDPLELVKGCLRVQEAAELYLTDAQGKKRPASKWTEHTVLRTYWP